METAVNAIKNATMATNAALNLISNIYDTIDKEKLPAQQPSAPIDNTAASADDEINTHPITHKKVKKKYNEALILFVLLT